jgi:hypothetical protein
MREKHCVRGSCSRRRCWYRSGDLRYDLQWWVLLPQRRLLLCLLEWVLLPQHLPLLLLTSILRPDAQ